jgi:hypothetical protein
VASLAKSKRDRTRHVAAESAASAESADTAEAGSPRLAGEQDTRRSAGGDDLSTGTPVR